MSYEETKLKIDSLKEKVAAHGKLTDEQLKKINYKFRLEWNYTSNSMEGNTLTIDETRSVMVGNIDVHQKPYKHVAEMKGHDEVISEILKVGKGEIRLSESRIKQIHTSIMYEESDEMKARVGDWKKQNNHIINRKGEKFDFTDWELIPDKIHDLLNRTNAAIDAVQYGKKKDVKHPLDIAFDFHLEYLTIHPFYDGNGRTARILTNLILISFGYPPFWITEKEKASYYAYLTDIQGYGGDRKLLDAFMAGLVLRSQQLVVNVIEGEDIEEEDDLDKEIALLKANFETLSPLKNSELSTIVYKNIKDNQYIEVLRLLAKFEIFFNKYHNEEIINGKSDVSNGAFSDIISVIPLITNLTLQQLNATDSELYEIELICVLSELNKGKSRLSLKTDLKIRFETDYYKHVFYVNGDLISDHEYRYNQFPSKDDTKYIIRTIKEYFLLLLKEQTT